MVCFLHVVFDTVVSSMMFFVWRLFYGLFWLRCFHMACLGCGVSGMVVVQSFTIAFICVLSGFHVIGSTDTGLTFEGIEARKTGIF